MIITDFHIHSNFSGDSPTPPELQIQAAIQLGLKTICFTDHEDFDHHDGNACFEFDPVPYFETLKFLQEKYRSQIDIRIGVELGLQPHLKDFLKNFVHTYPFDYVIGSTHLIDGLDPYYARYWNNRVENEEYRKYYETTLKNIKTCDSFDCYGHIDYIVRYGPTKNENYSYWQYQDIIDEILKTLIAKGKGIECNSAGFKYGLGKPNPEATLIKRYLELGGEILTIGSDGHKPEHVAYDFKRLYDYLQECGVKYYTVFKNRKPEFIPL